MTEPLLEPASGSHLWNFCHLHFGLEVSLCFCGSLFLFCKIQGTVLSNTSSIKADWTKQHDDGLWLVFIWYLCWLHLKCSSESARIWTSLTSPQFYVDPNLSWEVCCIYSAAHLCLQDKLRCGSKMFLNAGHRKDFSLWKILIRAFNLKALEQLPEIAHLMSCQSDEELQDPATDFKMTVQVRFKRVTLPKKVCEPLQ